MPQHTTPRQPLSCENCRKRKIKCHSGQVPCATCVKRGYAQSCFYKRSEYRADLPPNNQNSHRNESELLHRVRNLEDLLKQQIQITKSSQSPPEHWRGNTPSRSNDSSPRFGSETPSGTIKPQQTGTILTSPGGYQHLVPRGSALDAGLVLTESVPSPLCASNFPFSSETTVSRNALLDILPPLRQCDELKGIFFEVFSPVRYHTSEVEDPDTLPDALNSYSTFYMTPPLTLSMSNSASIRPLRRYHGLLCCLSLWVLQSQLWTKTTHCCEISVARPMPLPTSKSFQHAIGGLPCSV